jgi:hypothetical protein
VGFAGLANQSCYNAVTNYTAGCTAGDINVNSINIVAVKDGCVSATDTTTANIKLQVNSAQPTRYDIGLWLATDGGSARTGTCFKEALFPVAAQDNTGAVNTTSGIGPFLNRDGDTCGDVENGNTYARNLVIGDVSSGSTAFADITIPCIDNYNTSGDATPNGYVDMGWVASWDQNAGSSCNSVLQALPGTVSKCQQGNTDTANTGNPIPIGVPNLGLTINCTPDLIYPKSPNPMDRRVQCTVTYTNTSALGRADNIEFRIAYPTTGVNAGSVSNLVPATGNLASNVPAGGYILFTPGSSSPPGAGNILPNKTTNNTLTFDFTVNQNTSPGPVSGSFNITAQTWYNNGTNTVNQNLNATDTTNTTAALLSSFSLSPQRSGVLVQWETAQEVGTAGFHLERLDPATGQYARVTEVLLPSVFPHLYGGIYNYVDAGAAPHGTYTYRVVEVEQTGAEVIHGPYEATVETTGVRRMQAADNGQGFTRQPRQPDPLTVQNLNAKQQQRAAEIENNQQQRSLQAANDKSNRVQPVAKLFTSGAGLQYISMAALAPKLGATDKTLQDALRKQRLLISNNGAPVRYLPASDYTGLYLVAEAFANNYTNQNVYVATLARNNSGDSSFMQTYNGAPTATGTNATSFVSQVVADEDVWLVPYAVNNPHADMWFAGFVSTGYYGNTPYMRNLDAPGAAASGNARMRLWMQGATDLVLGNDHHALIKVNGQQVGEAQWDGLNPTIAEVSFAQSLLREQGNTIEVSGVLDAGVKQSSFLVDRVELSYNRSYRAYNDNLLLTGAAGTALTVTGLNGSDVVVFDLSNPKQPRTASGVKVASGSVSFTPAVTDAKHLVTRFANAKAPVEIVADSPSDLRNPFNNAEYLVIAPSSLRVGADELAAYRRARFNTMVVELEDIYDEFNNGIPDAKAIKDFLAFARQEWQRAPTFIVLAGKGTLDPKDIKGYGSNVLPLLMVPTPYGLFASDNRYADVVGNDDVPEFVIGRIPALSSQDLITYASKLAAYEVSQGGLSRKALILTDNSDPAGDFFTDGKTVEAAYPFSVTLTQYTTGGNVANIRQNLLDQINAGTGMINYIGHASVGQLGHEGFLRYYKAPQPNDLFLLNNGSRLPFLAAFTCYVGNGTIPGLDSLTDGLLGKADGGIVAAYAPTGMSLNDDAVRLNKAFVAAAYSGNQTAGEAVRTAVGQARDTGVLAFLPAIYNYLGDPAIQLR